MSAATSLFEFIEVIELSLKCVIEDHSTTVGGQRINQAARGVIRAKLDDMHNKQSITCGLIKYY